VEIWGLNFSLNKKELILSFSKDGLINILRGLKAGTKSLRESERFSIQIVNAPRNVGEISYIYPYGFLGAIKYAINFYLDFQATFLSGEQTSKEEIALMQEMASSIFQFLDKAIAPYLKMFASVGGYSFTPENGLVVKKSKIAIEELSDWEKEQVETFWFNIDDWINQRFGAFAF